MSTPRAAVERALAGEYPGHIPFTIYENKIRQSEMERELRNRGLCIVNRTVPVFATVYRDVNITSHTFTEEGVTLTRTVFSTPVGEVSTLVQPQGFTTWVREKMFKSREDYRVIRFLMEHEHYIPSFDAVVQAQKDCGGDVIFRGQIGLEPLQSFVSGNLMDMETFCYEWMDSRDEILDIVGIIRENRRKAAQIVADSPVLHANYGGNVTVEVIGEEVFAEHYVPCYDEAAEILHRKGKKIGSHFDGNCGRIAGLIAESGLDYIEAFTPAPDTDMTLAEALEIWHGKVLWLNFPSSLHLKSDREIAEIAATMFEPCRTRGGLIVGVTEDMPPERGLCSCRAIMDGLQQIR